MLVYAYFAVNLINGLLVAEYIVVAIKKMKKQLLLYATKMDTSKKEELTKLLQSQINPK